MDYNIHPMLREVASQKECAGYRAPVALKVLLRTSLATCDIMTNCMLAMVIKEEGVDK